MSKNQLSQKKHTALPEGLHPDTLMLHADAALEDTADIAPPLHASTTFDAENPDGLVYSRYDQPTRRRLEAVLGALEGGHALTYASGLASVHALVHYLRPKRVAIRGGYFGVHALLHRLAPEGVSVVDLDDAVEQGDLVWLETPRNPTCEVEDIAAYAKRAHAAGAWLGVDSTFASPVLQKPLELGADFVMHASTKFLAGHTDALGGVLVAATEEHARGLAEARKVTGAVMGALETWLTLRSLRTLGLRVERQSASAAQLAAWLSTRVPKTWHPSLPGHPGHALLHSQMRGMGGGVLSIDMADEAQARSLPARLRLFREATSLGGVESLIEWRRRNDPMARPTLLRISVGLEHADDLIADFSRALEG